ncbi:MAG TPA: hypothetical protein ENH15_00690, partial [Actinobacteria bacterium]|nr:hypothetical protein [Actinomycetota bacterium]
MRAFGKSNRRKLTAIAIGFALVAAACGGGDEDTATTQAPAGSTAAATPVCPANIVIQSDWFPEAEHGMAYNLIGADGEQDTSNGVYSGPLQAKYADRFPTGEVPNIEIRAGGPFLGDQLVTHISFLDDDITFAFQSNDQGIQFSQDFPMLAVMAPLEINPQVLLFDPDE